LLFFYRKPDDKAPSFLPRYGRPFFSLTLPPFGKSFSPWERRRNCLFFAFDDSPPPRDQLPKFLFFLFFSPLNVSTRLFCDEYHPLCLSDFSFFPPFPDFFPFFGSDVNPFCRPLPFGVFSVFLIKNSSSSPPPEAHHQRLFLLSKSSPCMIAEYNVSFLPSRLFLRVPHQPPKTMGPSSPFSVFPTVPPRFLFPQDFLSRFPPAFRLSPTSSRSIPPSAMEGRLSLAGTPLLSMSRPLSTIPPPSY